MTKKSGTIWGEKRVFFFYLRPFPPRCCSHLEVVVVLEAFTVEAPAATGRDASGNEDGSSIYVTHFAYQASVLTWSLKSRLFFSILAAICCFIDLLRAF